MSLDDEVVRHTLLWLAEQQTIEVERKTAPLSMAPCSKCGHDRSDHAVSRESSPWPCNFPHSRGAPAILCYCHDYEPSTGDEYGYPGGEAT